MELKNEIAFLDNRWKSLTLFDYTTLRSELLKYGGEGYTIPPDPTSTGTAEFNILFSNIDSALDRVSTMVLELLGSESEVNSVYRDVMRLYNEKMNQCLLNEETQKLRNQQLQKADAESKIDSSLMALKFELEKELEDVERIIKESKMKLTRLADKKDTVSRQITVIQTQLQIGEISRK